MAAELSAFGSYASRHGGSIPAYHVNIGQHMGIVIQLCIYTCSTAQHAMSALLLEGWYICISACPQVVHLGHIAQATNKAGHLLKGAIPGFQAGARSCIGQMQRQHFQRYSCACFVAGRDSHPHLLYIYKSSTLSVQGYMVKEEISILGYNSS